MLAPPSQRLQQLLAKVAVAQPYEVTEDIVISPPTKRRRDAMSDANMNLQIQNSVLQKAISRVGPARPEYPKAPVPPEPLGKNPRPDHLESYQAAVSEYGTAVEHFQKLVSEWETQLGNWEAGVARQQEALDDISEKIQSEAKRYTRELFGDSHDAVVEFFDGQPPELWDVFVDDIKQAFGIIPKPEQLPDDGSCPSCGHIEDVEQAGKAPTSETSSKTIGTQ